MNHSKKFTIIGLILIAGIGSFIYDQFIVSTVLFASAAICSNIVMRVKLNS
jgi:hypothetical protein